MNVPSCCAVRIAVRLNSHFAGVQVIAYIPEVVHFNLQKLHAVDNGVVFNKALINAVCLMKAMVPQ